jgi:hypothetical protein
VSDWKSCRKSKSSPQASDDRDALNLVKAHQPDVVLMNIQDAGAATDWKRPGVWSRSKQRNKVRLKDDRES